ncbi:SNF2 family N-terminal domain-containing protein [Lentinula lateritia]|uniref:SNF2 family N-terminal domain-containing protein n=1 Tax=Lentinula aff. lateritia TaxID=2804960 RepID=A0ACC1TMB7_9AGAR|nr:SNF2 family N-terminal domain-containing protein [Lentinula aff. lateritia]KAJ3849912.1 SNF2 family N-terminal domain-containing protein [Lentinula lateritia]
MPSFQTPLTTGKRRSDSSNENVQPFSSNNAKRLRLESRPDSNADDDYWAVQWRNHQAKKHKTWEGDGVLVVSSDGSRATLYDSTDGRQIGAGKTEMPLFNEKVVNVGGKNVGLDRKITKQEYLSGICFGSNSALIGQSTQNAVKHTAGKVFKPPAMRKPSLNTESANESPMNLTSHSLPRMPSLPMPSPSKDREDRSETQKTSSGPLFWAVNWRKTQSSSKKQITWEGDAFISCIDQKISMLSEEGKLQSTYRIGASVCKNHQHRSGDRCFVGGKELVLLNEVSAEALPFTNKYAPVENEPAPVPPSPALPSLNRCVPPASFYAVPPRLKKSIGPLHDPDAEDAVVMKPPTKEHMDRYNKKQRPVVPVVLDPILARRLRPHQREGVKFMYECVMGLRKHEGQGCILADEMGLGKTLQTITLVWTLLRQNAYAGAGPVISKVLIVCPVTLINNWKAEFHKWLGRDRVGVSICDRNTDTTKTFASSPRQQVLIVGYERLRTIMSQIYFCRVGLVVCDEGHRLKSSKAKTSVIFKQLGTLRRIILSGTPIQNDLGEFHSMVDFCNPGLLDEYSAFRRLYEVPIMKSRAPGCTTKELELGEKRSAQLSNIAKSFVLRREASILGNYLPPKHEYVVFVTPTELQLSIYAKVLDPNKVDDFVESNSTAESLALINILTKISSSPILLKATMDKEQSKSKSEGLRHNNVQEALKLLPASCEIEDLTLSGKMIAVSKLLAFVKQESEEKCVLVSHYTSTLNILESFCKKKNYSYFRLDGQTPAAKRQEYVTTFNKTNQRTSFIFLLSSKAGGTGINLIGASRLCLIDSDWNPSHDLQAMARCHRDGQKRPVFIYRFLTAGTIDEKIYQRQIIKLGLSNGTLSSASKSKADSFTRKDLRDIFRVHPETSSNTHDLLECICENGLEDDTLDDGTNDIRSECPKGFMAASQVNSHSEIHEIMEVQYLKRKKTSLASLEEWKHINCLKQDAFKEVKDDLLRRMLYVKPKKELVSHTGTVTEQILHSVDLENLGEMEPLTARTVPGGTVSFLFERSSVDAGEATSEEE